LSIQDNRAARGEIVAIHNGERGAPAIPATGLTPVVVLYCAAALAVYYTLLPIKLRLSPLGPEPFDHDLRQYAVAYAAPLVTPWRPAVVLCAGGVGYAPFGSAFGK
jgi:hypothetical protein